MKRRDFIFNSAAMLGSLPLSRAALGQETPCQPPGLGVIGGTADPTVACEEPIGPLGLPLYDPSKIVYQGAFTVPQGGRNVSGVNLTGNQYGLQGSGGIAYNPDGDSGRGSLFVAFGLAAGNPNEPCFCEISIPDPAPSNFDRASLLQNYELLGGSVGRFPNGHSGSNGTSCTGMLYKDGYLYFTAAGIYRDQAAATTLFRRSATNIADNIVDGPYAVVSSSLNQRAMGNGLGCPIPDVWQSTFGGATLLGGGGHNLSLLNSANYGPGFWVIDHNDVGGPAGSTIPGTSILRHNRGAQGGTVAGHWPYLGNYPDFAFSGMSTHRGTVMLPDSRTVLTYGTWAAESVYDTGGSISGLVQGPIALNGTAMDRFILYDARELKKAFDGVISDHEAVLPYSTHDMDFSISNGKYRPGWRAACWDVENRRLFVGDDNGAGGSYPLVHVLDFPI